MPAAPSRTSVAVRRSGALVATEGAWAEIKRDLGRHLLTALAIFVMNILIDLGYALLDPRIRY